VNSYVTKQDVLKKYWFDVHVSDLLSNLMAYRDSWTYGSLCQRFVNVATNFAKGSVCPKGIRTSVLALAWFPYFM
jgi:hypothetical protein